MVPFFETISPRGFIGWGKSTQLGYGLGLALGAKMAEPQKLAVNVMGDYAFGMVGLDVETAVRERIPILTIILNNSAMGIYDSDRFPVANERYGTKYLTGKLRSGRRSPGRLQRACEDPRRDHSRHQKGPTGDSGRTARLAGDNHSGRARPSPLRTV